MLDRSVFSVNLALDPVLGDSWLTASFIDATLLCFAHRYPGAHFLSTAFAAFDLPRARQRTQGRFTGVCVRDLLGRVVAPGSGVP
ncbi:MAG: hypothetical protein ACK4ZJ_17045, partial [Allorhizobium sp.]